MTALIACETVLLVLLVVLVAGLLRSHAEILRRLGPAPTGDADVLAAPTAGLRAPGVPAPRAGCRDPGDPAPDVAGATPGGDAIKLSLSDGRAGPMLLAFLSSGCTTCRRFWDGLRDRRLPGELGLVIVTHDQSRESRSRLRTLAPPGVTVVMSSAAYEQYGVPGAPYFVLVDGGIRGEGVATTWAALESLLTDAIGDAAEADGNGRAGRVEARLAAAGVAPDDPSLYPGSAASSTGAGSSPPGELPTESARMPTPPRRFGSAKSPNGVDAVGST